ncbi:oxidoreductase [Sphingosinicella terrae]|uniref:oxidoreductase n=1 Tax=Sphingosinicella terrae TaxID=2172047 RepID=UPI002548CABD|nr:oxidoreductase [Sphingosinicella terrae]
MPCLAPRGGARMTIGVGLIGYGLGGAVFHAPLIQACSGLSLEAVATSRPGPAGVATVRDPQALIDDPALSLIVVVTPNETHLALARAALEKGKHVVIDKPFVPTVAEADALIALAERQDRVLSVFHNRRWDGDFLTVRELVASGRLGEIMLAEMHWDRFRLGLRAGWKDRAAAGTGLLYDLGSHLIDQALQLFGPPDAVSADSAAHREGAGIDDYFDLTLAYGERRVRLCAATIVTAPRPRFALHGTGGSYVKYGLDPQEPQLQAELRPGDEGFAVEDPAWHGIFTDPDGRNERIATRPGRYLDYYAGIAAAIRGEASVPVDPADARSGLALIEAARRSAAEGRTIRL